MKRENILAKNPQCMNHHLDPPKSPFLLDHRRPGNLLVGWDWGGWVHHERHHERIIKARAITVRRNQVSILLINAPLNQCIR